MKRRDFAAVAHAVRKATQQHPSSVPVVVAVAVNIADALEERHSHFDRDHFYKDAGIARFITH